MSKTAETITIAHSETLQEFVQERGLDISSFGQQALKLGLLVEKSILYQMIGGTPHSLRMTDFQPHPKLPRPQEGAQVITLRIPPEIKEAIEETSPLKINEWFARAVSLRMMFENIDLRALTDNGEYQKVSF